VPLLPWLLWRLSYAFASHQQPDRLRTVEIIRCVWSRVADGTLAYMHATCQNTKLALETPCSSSSIRKYDFWLDHSLHFGAAHEENVSRVLQTTSSVAMTFPRLTRYYAKTWRALRVCLRTHSSHTTGRWWKRMSVTRKNHTGMIYKSLERENASGAITMTNRKAMRHGHAAHTLSCGKESGANSKSTMDGIRESTYYKMFRAYPFVAHCDGFELARGKLTSRMHDLVFVDPPMDCTEDFESTFSLLQHAVTLGKRTSRKVILAWMPLALSSQELASRFEADVKSFMQSSKAQADARNGLKPEDNEHAQSELKVEVKEDTDHVEKKYAPAYNSGRSAYKAALHAGTCRRVPFAHGAAIYKCWRAPVSAQMQVRIVFEQATSTGASGSAL
jgi:hypothetical protein